MSLAAAITSSLRTNGTAPSLKLELLTRDKTKAKNRNETEYWDYKQSIDLAKEADIAKLARHVLAFHNSKGGAVFYGIDDAYRVVGVDVSQTLDSKLLNDKLRAYVGPRVLVFQDFMQLTGNRGIWIVYIPPKKDLPVAIQKDGPADVRSGRIDIKRNTFFLRTGDESKACQDPIDICGLFTNVDASQQEAYALDIDEPYFRLLAPHCERFVGRANVMDQIRGALALRHPVVSLDGLGGVGKSAVAIELTRQFYDANEYEFIVSLSAKSRVWQGHVVSRVAGFSGFSEFLQVLAHSLAPTLIDDLDKLKSEVLEAMRGCKGLVLVDNIEDVKDEQILQFLFREVPDPVKILVTSRVDRGMGALSVPIPEMNEDEARELFEFELARQGYKRGQSDSASIRAIVETTGRIPLALKWSAATAARTSSLGAAEQIFRGAPTVKQEFLTFCFTTMFEGLSDNAKAVALLNPYLERNWTLPILSIALDISEEFVLHALSELEDRGVVVSRGASSESMPSLLPLTKDFLAIKARQEGNLEKSADALLAAALGAANPLLAGLDPAKRADILINAIRKKIDDGQLDEAERSANVLRQVLNGSENHWGRFLAGQILFLQGKKIPGKELMQQAIAAANGTEPAGNFEVTFGQLMIYSDSREDRHDGCLSLIKAAAAGEELAPSVAFRIVESLLRQGDYPGVRSLISLSHKAAVTLQIAKAIERADVAASTQKQHEIGPSLLTVFEEAAKSKSSDLSDYERHRFLTFAANLAKTFGGRVETKR
jgi:hypothetical protein